MNATTARFSRESEFSENFITLKIDHVQCLTCHENGSQASWPESSLCSRFT